VDLLKFCGQHKGKAAVVEFFARLVPEVLDIRGFEPDELLIDGDRAAALGRLIATQNGSERVISYRIGHFLRFRDEKLVSFRSLIDSFDLAEQLIGHRIDLSKHLPQTDIPGDLVAV
jgi:ketosteroid isomerase-like protein